MDIEANYQRALDYIFSFVDYSLTKMDRSTAAHFELERMRRFMAHLGHPEQAYPIIHIAGTKGKGSVAVLCASALQSAGYRVGLYTSPHLDDYAERIQINRQLIPHADLVGLVDEIRPYLDAGTKLTTFEITTALAFLYFARQGVNAAVIEVGLGGRLDATNVTVPLVTVITSISYDHTAILGNTLTEIAREKGGIIKPGIPLVIAPQQEEAVQVIEHIAIERGAPLIEVGRDYCFAGQSHSVFNGQSLLVWAAAPAASQNLTGNLENQDTPKAVELTIPLLGRHQIENAAIAYVALQVGRHAGLAITNEHIQDGFKKATWPGRFEILQHQPPVVIDSAHNRDSALKLRLALEDYFPGIPVVLVFGASEDKDVQGMFSELVPCVRQVVATRSIHPRALDPDAVVELARSYAKPVVRVDEIGAALIEAQRLAGDQALVLVTGSIFVAAGARQSWFNSRVK